MNIVIIGSNGILGQDLKKVLIESNHTVTCIELDTIDIRELDMVEKAFKNIVVDLLIYAKGYEDVFSAQKYNQLAYEINAIGAKNLAHVCKNRACPMLYISSYLVFDGLSEVPYLPEDEVRPLNAYGKSKLAGERFIQETIDNFYIFRTGKLFGDMQVNYIDNLVEKAKAGRDFKAYQDVLFAPTWTFSVAKAINKLIDTYKCKINFGVYHCSNSGKCTDYMLISEIIHLMGLYNKIYPINYSESVDEISFPLNGMLNNSKTPGMIIHWSDALRNYFKVKKYIEAHI